MLPSPPVTTEPSNTFACEASSGLIDLRFFVLVGFELSPVTCTCLKVQHEVAVP